MMLSKENYFKFDIFKPLLFYVKYNILRQFHSVFVIHSICMIYFTYNFVRFSFNDSYLDIIYYVIYSLINIPYYNYPIPNNSDIDSEFNHYYSIVYIYCQNFSFHRYNHFIQYRYHCYIFNNYLSYVICHNIDYCFKHPNIIHITMIYGTFNKINCIIYYNC